MTNAAEVRIVNPDRPLRMSDRIIPTLTAKKDLKLRKKLVALSANLRAADAPMSQAGHDWQYERITEAQYDALYAKMVAAYDELANVVEYITLPT